MHNSEHYVFHYLADSFAQQQIENIISEQEYCYKMIMKRLRVLPLSFPIKYFLYDSPEDVGVSYSRYDPEEPVSPCNGFAHQPDEIHAVFNPEVRCMGFHEDVHLFAAQQIGYPRQTFVREGLAMFFDEVWWGLPNKLWAQALIHEGQYPGLGQVFDNEKFYDLPSELTYPVAGAFTEYLIQVYGQETYNVFYKILEHDDDIEQSIQKTFSCNLRTLDVKFIEYVNYINYSPKLYALVTCHNSEKNTAKAV